MSFKSVETNRRRATPLDARWKFGHAVHARPCVSGGSRSLLSFGVKHVTPIDPSPYLVVCGVLVFLVPWLIYGSFIVRALVYAQRKGISLFSWSGSSQMRMLRQTDSYAAFLHQRARRWFFITLTVWLIGFAVMGLTLYLLHRRGIV